MPVNSRLEPLCAIVIFNRHRIQRKMNIKLAYNNNWWGQHISVTETYSSTSIPSISCSVTEKRFFVLMLILLRLPAHITAHRKCTLDISLWCRRCNKIKCHRGKNGERIFWWRLSCQKARPVSQNCSQWLISAVYNYQVQYPAQIQRWILRLKDNCNLLQ